MYYMPFFTCAAAADAILANKFGADLSDLISKLDTLILDNSCVSLNLRLVVLPTVDCIK